jgi:hypothetical protein
MKWSEATQKQSGRFLLAAANHDGNTNGLLRYWQLLIL